MRSDGGVRGSPIGITIQYRPQFRLDLACHADRGAGLMGRAIENVDPWTWGIEPQALVATRRGAPGRQSFATIDAPLVALLP